MPQHKKPLNVLQMQGTYRSDRHADRGREPDSGPLDPRPPAELPPLAAAVWAELVRAPVASIWQKSDTAALTIFCKLAAHNRAQVMPANRWPVYWSLMNSLGLTPAARCRLQPPDPKPRGRPPGRGKSKGLSAFVDDD